MLGGPGLYDVGLNVSLCFADDLTCSSPVDTGTTDSSGTVLLHAPLDGGPFIGYVDAVDPNFGPDAGVLEDLVYTQPFINALSLVPVTFSQQDRIQYGPILGNPNLDTKGGLLAEIHDCQDVPVAGATMTTTSTDPSTIILYVAGGLPSLNAHATDASGRLLIMNVPPSDSFGLTTYNDQGAISGQYTVVVKAGAITSVFARPNQ